METPCNNSIQVLYSFIKIKILTNNLAAIGEPVIERDQVLQLLGGLGAEYNSIITSLTAREDEVSLHSVHNILLTHEQRLQFQNSITEETTLSTHIASHSRITQSRTSQNNKNNFSLH